DLALAGPIGHQRHGPIDVAVLRPLGIVHGGLGGDPDVVGEGRDDVAVPDLLNQSARASGSGGHGAHTMRNSAAAPTPPPCPPSGRPAGTRRARSTVRGRTRSPRRPPP